MQFPGEISAAQFLADYWQRRPLFVPGGLPPGLPELTANELAWLATLADVESRLVFTERSQKTCKYRIEHGPFSDQQLSALPEQDWTLLVQDVEKHLPDFRAWFDCVDFIADWRIDDLMVSFAAPGGSAGPHRDNYDVFLCQGPGARHWRLAADGADVREVQTEGALLLEPFTADVRHLASAGDVLYLPPAVPHWGIAAAQCMTYSIGMRAPDLSELHCGFERLFPHSPPISVVPLPAGGDRQVFADPDRQATESERGRISAADLARVRSSFPSLAALAAGQLAILFGSVVTDPKAWLAPDQPDRATAESLLQRLSVTPGLKAHGMARLAWYGDEAGAYAFANGHHRELAAVELPLMQGLCRQRRLCLHGRSAADDLSDLCRWLIRHGAVDGTSEGE